MKIRILSEHSYNLLLHQQIDIAAITSEITTQVYSTSIRRLYVVYKNQKVRNVYMLYLLKKKATDII